MAETLRTRAAFPERPHPYDGEERAGGFGADSFNETRRDALWPRASPVIRNGRVDLATDAPELQGSQHGGGSGDETARVRRPLLGATLVGIGSASLFLPERVRQCLTRSPNLLLSRTASASQAPVPTLSRSDYGATDGIALPTARLRQDEFSCRRTHACHRGHSRTASSTPARPLVPRWQMCCSGFRRFVPDAFRSGRRPRRAIERVTSARTSPCRCDPRAGRAPFVLAVPGKPCAACRRRASRGAYRSGSGTFRATVTPIVFNLLSTLCATDPKLWRRAAAPARPPGKGDDATLGAKSSNSRMSRSAAR